MFTLLSRPRPVTLAERFAWNIRAIREALAMRAAKGVFADIAGPAHAIPFAYAICIRFGRILNRFNILLEKRRNGIPPPKPRPSRAKPRDAKPRPAEPATPPDTTRTPALPRRLGWLPGLVPEILGFAGNLRLMLAEPEMEALIAADPRVGRILRPLCHLLGFNPPPTPAPRHPGCERAPHPFRKPGQCRAEPRAKSPTARPLPLQPPASWRTMP